MRSGDGGSEVVLFCGDGADDAIALSEPDIGLHMNEGTDIAKTPHSFGLLSSILVLLDVSKAAHHHIVFTLLSLHLRRGGCFASYRRIYRCEIPPQYAGLGELVSCLPSHLWLPCKLRWAKAG